MREDFAKLLCERERPRSKDKFRYYRKEVENRHFQETEDGDILGPKQMSRGLTYGWNKKEFNENLNPLRGIIRKWVGKRWDDFYSVLCQNFDRGNRINDHIFQHLYQYIETKVFEKNGEYWIHRRYGDPVRVEDQSDYWVHPITNIIMKVENETYRQEVAKRNKERETELRKYRRTISERIELFCIRGVWYEFTFEKIKVKEVKKQRFDSIKKETVEYIEKVVTPDHCLLSGYLCTLFDKGRMKGKPWTEEKLRQVYGLGGYYYNRHIKWQGADYTTPYGIYGKAAVKVKQLSTKEKKSYGVK